MRFGDICSVCCSTGASHRVLATATRRISYLLYPVRYLVREEAYPSSLRMMRMDLTHYEPCRTTGSRVLFMCAIYAARRMSPASPESKTQHGIQG